MRLWILASALMLSADPAAAQTAHLVCDYAGGQGTVRAEERTALLGDVHITCASSDAGLPGPAAELTVSLSVKLDVPVTNNRDFGEGTNLIDAVLVVNGANCVTPAATGGEFSCGEDYQDPQYGKVLADGRTVQWEAVNLPFPGETNPQSGETNPAETLIQVKSLRGDVSSLGIPPPGSTEVLAEISVEPPGTVQLLNSVSPVGHSRLALPSSIESVVSGLQCLDQEAGEASTAIVRIEGGGGSTFRLEGSPSFFPMLERWEAGYYAPGSLNGAGADGPTQVALAFSDIPQGVGLEAPLTIGDGSVSLTLQGTPCGA